MPRQVQVVTATPRMKRQMRKPQLSFNLRHKPYQMQPFCIHPVLPGETLKNGLLNVRCASDPLVDKLMGWWLEHYIFYVKHTDLDIAADLREMHLDATKDMSSFASAANLQMFHAGGINFTSKCLDAVKEWYFRDEDEAEPAAIDGLPPAKVNHDGWWESMKLASEAPTPEHELAGDDPKIPYAAPAGYETEYTQWEHMRAAGLTDATFEDYLRSFGVKIGDDHQDDEERQRPELLRYSKNFTYPTNTVEPTTGVPSSAAVWSEATRMDKDRFFKEPGFIFGVTVVRPKIHYENIVGSITSYMDKFDSWLPAILADMPFSSLVEFASGAGPAPEAYGENYWVDMRDLFIYGEQFRNHDGLEQGNFLALPDTSGNHEFANQAMVDAMFAGGTADVRYFRQDGLLSLDIAGKAGRDTT